MVSMSNINTGSLACVFTGGAAVACAAKATQSFYGAANEKSSSSAMQRGLDHLFGPSSSKTSQSLREAFEGVCWATAAVGAAYLTSLVAPSGEKTSPPVAPSFSGSSDKVEDSAQNRNYFQKATDGFSGVVSSGTDLLSKAALKAGLTSGQPTEAAPTFIDSRLSEMRSAGNWVAETVSNNPYTTAAAMALGLLGVRRHQAFGLAQRLFTSVKLSAQGAASKASSLGQAFRAKVSSRSSDLNAQKLGASKPETQSPSAHGASSGALGSADSDDDDSSPLNMPLGTRIFINNGMDTTEPMGSSGDAKGSELGRSASVDQPRVSTASGRSENPS